MKLSGIFAATHSLSFRSPTFLQPYAGGYCIAFRTQAADVHRVDEYPRPASARISSDTRVSGWFTSVMVQPCHKSCFQFPAERSQDVEKGETAGSRGVPRVDGSKSKHSRWRGEQELASSGQRRRKAPPGSLPRLRDRGESCHARLRGETTELSLQSQCAFGAAAGNTITAPMPTEGGHLRATTAVHDAK